MKKNKKLTAHGMKNQPMEAIKREIPIQHPSKAKPKSWVDEIDWFGEK